MNAIRTRLQLNGDSEAGLTLVEVIVAFMIFTIIAVGAAFALTSTLAMTKDGRSREIAANLAAQDLDLIRSIADVTTLGDSTKNVVVNNVNYHLVRNTSWVLSGASTGCGTGGGTLQYKEANVTVSWDGMKTSPVTADTLIAPASRINDPSLGTLIISVNSAAGTGNAGVTVTATPTAGVAGNTAQALTTVPSPTDADGCSYILKVFPGTYDVTVSKTNYVSDKQSFGSVTKNGQGVSAGGSVSVGFQFDLAANYAPVLAANYTTSSPLVPTNIDTTYLNTYGTWYTTAPAASPVQLHPYSAGYSVFAGKYVATSALPTSCLSPDPAAWTTPAADLAVGQRQPAVAAAPGARVDFPVNMGIVKLNSVSGGVYVTAVGQVSADGTGDPGCLVPATYTFAKVGGSVLALPYGSWALYSGNSAGAKTTLLGSSNLTPLTRGVVSPTGVISLDPRTVQLP